MKNQQTFFFHKPDGFPLSIKMTPMFNNVVAVSGCDGPPSSYNHNLGQFRQGENRRKNHLENLLGFKRIAIGALMESATHEEKGMLGNGTRQFAVHGAVQPL
jgi:hypothetical protein